MTRKILVVGFNFSYHDAFSGYGRLMKYFGDGQVFDYTHLFSDGNYSFLGAILRRLLVECLTLVKGMRADVIHYIYPEGTIFISPLVLKYVFRKKIVMTFHLDPSWFNSYPASDGIMRGVVRRVFQGLAYRSVLACDHGIALTTGSVDAYRQAYGLSHVTVVPHGIVVDDFVESSKKRLLAQKPSVCIVGRNYRDWDFVNAVLARDDAHRYRFHLVGVDFDKVTWPQDVEVHAHRLRLDHEQYVDVLHQCLVMFLPLKFATANNAILEAYQNRVFVLTTRAGLNQDYQEPSLFEVESPESFFRLADRIHQGAEGMDIDRILDDVQQSAIRRFGWQGVIKQLEAIYEQV